MEIQIDKLMVIIQSFKKGDVRELFAHLTQLKDLERNDFFNLINLKFLIK